ncbi:MAG: N-acetylmuramoyl-L-alanine amidase [Clostridia bacterium]|nr:N-acetylmuramoyl-L-alanine amidase [Clostridia bacterium]
MIGSDLAKEKYPACVGNYTKGREGQRIEKVTLHHMAGVLTARRCGDIFAVPGREGSAHYGIGYEGEIAQYVSESDTAWADGNWDSNIRSVTIECSNDERGGDWHVSDATIASLTELLADIAIRNGLGFYEKGRNLTWHQMYSATACPGPYMLSRMDDIVRHANDRITQKQGGGGMVVTPVSISYQVNDGRWLPPVDGADQSDPDNGYAGVIGNPISGVLAKASAGNLFYRAHVPSGWLPEVKNTEDYAGLIGTPIDGFMIRSDVTTLHYQAHTTKDGWLPAVNGYEENDHDNGYAGILGHNIDALIIWADPLITAAEPIAEPTPEPEPVEEPAPAPEPEPVTEPTPEPIPEPVEPEPEPEPGEEPVNEPPEEKEPLADDDPYKYDTLELEPVMVEKKHSFTELLIAILEKIIEWLRR